MTIAVCVRCGALKHGAITVCDRCGGAPISDHEFALAMGLTDHYMDVTRLENVGKAIEGGQLVSLPDDFMETMQRELNAMRHMFPKFPRTKEPIEPLVKQSDPHPGGLCFSCWGYKPIFYARCPECRSEPNDEQAMTKSVAVSGFFFTEKQLRELSHRIRLGPGDIDLWPARAKSLRAIAQKFLEKKAEPSKKTAPPDGQSPGAADVPWKPAPFNPMLPDLERATFVHGDEGASFSHAIYKDARPLMDRAEPTGYTYPLVFMMYSKTISGPVYFVTLERAGGPTFLCAFDGDGQHVNFGDGAAYSAVEAFTEKAMQLTSRELENRLRS